MPSAYKKCHEHMRNPSPPLQSHLILERITPYVNERRPNDLKIEMKINAALMERRKMNEMNRVS